MASIKRLKLYASIQAGKRLVSVSTADLQALKIWLWRNGYRWQTNTIGKVTNVMIDERK